MYQSRDDFIRAVTKIAQDTQVGDNEGQSITGQQTDDVPKLLQPDDGPGAEPNRAEFESFSEAGEEGHEENREEGFLPNAFNQFGAAAKQTGKDLSAVLDSFGKDSITSKATTDAARESLETGNEPSEAKEKESAVRLSAFADELRKITGR